MIFQKLFVIKINFSKACQGFESNTWSPKFIYERQHDLWSSVYYVDI